MWALRTFIGASKFQSLWVFKFVATEAGNVMVTDATKRFQSLSGFQVRCNICRLRCLLRRLLVSIPIGFSSSLQLCSRSPFHRPLPVVSIPIGFSSSLQRPNHAQAGHDWGVSIPIGFSSSLQRQWLSESLQHPEMFQSLSGFQVRCNL